LSCLRSRTSEVPSRAGGPDDIAMLVIYTGYKIGKGDKGAPRFRVMSARYNLYP
jgi:hypothetical protein